MSFPISWIMGTAALVLANLASAGGSLKSSGLISNTFARNNSSECNKRLQTSNEALSLLLLSFIPTGGFQLARLGHSSAAKNTRGLRSSRHAAHRTPVISMKGAFGWKRFSVDMWYNTELEPEGQAWVSPWSKAHYKLRQLEVEIERTELMMQAAIDRQDFDEISGLEMRVERLRDQHPIIPREEVIEDAIRDENYVLAKLVQTELDTIKANLGLPKFAVGQSVRHKRRGTCGIVMDVDLQCTRDWEWIKSASQTEKVLDHTDAGLGKSNAELWAKQPFYTVLCDLREDANILETSLWCAPKVGNRQPAFYLAQDALELNPEDADIDNPQVEEAFVGYEVTPHRGRVYKPSPRLRLAQQKRQEQRDAKRRANVFKEV